MKLFTLSFLLFFFIQVAYSQNYKVIHVNGKIQKMSNKQLLDRGSGLKTDDKLNYLTQGARAVVVDADAGKRMILENASTGEASVKASMSPSMGNISSRSGSLLQRLDVKNHFQGKYVILETLKIPINPQVFPQNDTQFFFVRIVYKGEPINKKLFHHADTLMIHKDSLLRVDGKPINNEDITEMHLMYYSKVNDNITTSSISDSFYPVFPDLQELKKEVELLLTTLPKDYDKTKFDFVNGYIQDAYGKTNSENIKVWFDKNFEE